MRRRFASAATLLTGLLLCGGLDIWRAAYIEQVAFEHFQREAGQRVSNASVAIQRALSGIEVMRALFVANPQPQPQDFYQLAQALQRTPGVDALLAAEPVGGAQREQFEAHWREVYPDYTLRFRNALGQQVRSPPRREYLPVVYGPPTVPSQFSIGLDLASDRLLAPALLNLPAQELRLSAPYRAGNGKVAALMMGWLGSTRATRLLGLTIAPDAIAATLPENEAIHDVWFDVSDPGRAELLYPAELSNADLPLRLLASRDLNLGGRRWRLEARLNEDAVNVASSLGRVQIWLLGGLLSLFSALLMFRLNPTRLSAAELPDSQQLRRELDAAQAAAVSARRDGLRLQTILDTTSEAIVLIDDAGSIERFNRAAERLFAYSAEDVLGLNIDLLMPAMQRARREEASKSYQPAGQNRTSGSSCELLAQKKDGSAFPVELSLNQFTLGESRYFVGVIRDVSDRKRAERMLFESEYKHRAILDAAHIGIYVLQDEQLRYVNPAFAAYFGHSPSDLVERRSLYDLIASAWREALAVAIDPDRSGGRPTEVLMQRPDGSHFYALITAKPILFDNRPGLAGSLLDISARKAAEEAMLRAEIRNVAILEAIPDLMLQLDISGNVVDCRGRAGSGEFGLARDIVGHHYRYLPGDFAIQLDAALTEGWPARVRSFEYSLPLDSGERQFEARVTPASEGEWLVMLRDITERKQIELELVQHRDHLAELVRERTAELNTLFAASPLPTVFVAQHNIVEVNAAFEALFGYPKASLIGQSIRLLLDSDEAFQRLSEQAYRPMVGGSVVRLEVHYRAVDGELVLCESFGKAVDSADPLAGSIWVYQDIGERRAAEEALRAAKELAETANRAKSEFLANMSHELRTPMHAVLSFAELGERRAFDAVPDKLTHYFARIRQSGQRLLQILNDLLDLSKLEAGKMSYNMQVLEIVPIVREVAGEFIPLARDRGIRINGALADDLPRVRGDSLRLIQVLRNLVSNALKFSPEGGAVTLSAWQMGNSVLLAVDDEGVGIPEQELAIIFDKFVQSSETKTGAGGTGLGLAISREIVDAHGGSLRAENRVQGGARFVLSLPIAAAN
ncbi:PAS domain S-box protein [Chitinimonas arctica]|uniref:histidine kinase n=1 Tax=Chitinimonas arctica TaxID=2594795 RepID=A0A516SD25_9NEIS|nr:PAS domain S-box protein [Chitinimonas arctica]QDQ26063.1 PAS domain S-box protein [Chitinimonas arctica]